MAVGERAQTVWRRRTVEEARGEILRAASALLRERPSAEVTVLAVMARTTLSRKSFYVYFHDRADLLTALVAPLRQEADAAVRKWHEAPDMVAAGRRALRSTAEMYRRDGELLRALASASEQDKDVAAVWATFVGPLMEVAAEKIRVTGADLHDPDATARALVLMNVSYLLDQLAGRPHADVEAAVHTLSLIWERTIFA